MHRPEHCPSCARPLPHNEREAAACSAARSDCCGRLILREPMCDDCPHRTRESDAATTDLAAEIQAQIAVQFEVKLDAEFWFGAVANEWTHEERCRRLAEAFDSLWHDKGGDGEHPASARYRRAAA